MPSNRARVVPFLMFVALAVGCRSGTHGPTMKDRTRTVGTSVQGRELVVHYFDGAPSRSQRPVLILAAIHGNETETAPLARAFVEHLRNHPGDLHGQNVAVLCQANPDGCTAGTRVNANGVDLNRNFPAKNWRTALRRTQYFNGTEPASEPETRALMRLIDDLKPVRICSIHSIDRDRQQNNYDGPGEGIAKAMAAHNGYPVTPTIGYPTPGSFGSWAGIDRGIPTITLELPRRIEAEKAWEVNRKALVAFVRGE
jgi:protein MpaA